MPERAQRAIMGVAVWEWIALVIGAFQTSSRIALNTPQLGTAHAVVGAGAILAALGVSLWARLPRAALWLTWASLGLSGVSGWISSTSRAAIVWHSAFSHLAVGVITAAAVLTSASWRQPSKPRDAGSWQALRPAAIWIPPVVLLQITLGALYRHQILGVMWHMLGAMVVAILALVVAMAFLQHFGDQPQLKNAATALLAMVLTQVCLGIAAFLMILLGAGNTPPFVWLTTGHVLVGSLTFAAGVIVAMQAYRYLSPPDAA